MSDAAMPNNALQTDKVELSRLLHAQGPRQLAFARSLGVTRIMASIETCHTQKPALLAGVQCCG
jgi:hypothetical protein